MLDLSRRQTLQCRLVTLAFGVLLTWLLSLTGSMGQVTPIKAEECDILWCGGGLGPTPTPTATPIS